MDSLKQLVNDDPHDCNTVPDKKTVQNLFPEI